VGGGKRFEYGGESVPTMVGTADRARIDLGARVVGGVEMAVGSNPGSAGTGGRLRTVRNASTASPNGSPSNSANQGCLAKTRSVLVMANRSARRSSTRVANSAGVRAWASTVPRIAPAEVAVMMSGVSPCSTMR